MTAKNMCHEASVEVAASPDDVYEMVSDLTRMGEWSPENDGGVWLSGEPSNVGARFEGHNSMGDRKWSTECEVTVADAGRCFEWAVGANYEEGPYVRWRFNIAPGDQAETSVLTETWDVEVLPPTLAGMPDDMIGKRTEMVKAGIEATLAAIKASAEA